MAWVAERHQIWAAEKWEANMLKVANTLELSDQDTSAEEVAPPADTGSEASIGLNQRQIDDLKRSLKKEKRWLKFEK